MKQKINKRIFLCGMMGSGKTTVGKLLAEKLDQPFIDLDDLIEENENRSIPEIFQQEGEIYFRKAERKAIFQVCDMRPGVVALGGGALQNQPITDYIKINGLLVFLKAPLSVLLERLSQDSGRPLLQQTDDTTIRNKIENLLARRNPLYSRSHITVNTETKSPEQISELITHKLSTYEN